MRGILALLALCAVVVAGAWWVQHLTGAIALTIGTLQVQAPLSVAVVALMLLVLVIYLVIRVLATVFGVPGAFRRRGDVARRRKGDEAVTGTLTALAAREPADARREAARARRLLGDTPQTLLLAAYAGSISGDDAEAEDAFRRLADRKDSAFLGLRGLLRMAISKGELEQAAALARDAEAAHPGAAWLRQERTQLAIRTGSWREALLLTQDDAPRAALGAAAAEAETNPEAARKFAKQAWKRDPSLVAAALAYARRLRQSGHERAAQDVLRRSWARTPHPELAAFALAPAPDKLARLKTGKALVAPAPDHPESHLLLGRLSLEAGLPGEATHHVEAARATGLNQRRLHMLAADIAESEHREPEHRDSLRQAAMADPDPAWRCEACGTIHGAWHAACDVCHAAGRIVWSAPGQGLVAVPEVS
jgi:HemY protein